VELEVVVCACSRPGLGGLVVQDATGIELLELGSRAGEFRPGDVIRIKGNRLLLRRRELGTQISAVPVIDNDGLHPLRSLYASVSLKAGQVPVEVHWFNCLRNYSFDLICERPNERVELQPALWHFGQSAGSTNRVPGLQVECYEGFWEKVPDFDLLWPVKTGITTSVSLPFRTTNFSLAFRTRDEMVGLRFTGFLDVPNDGVYSFRLASDDGSLLFLGPRDMSVTKLGATNIPVPLAGVIGEPMSHLDERRWAALQGRVSFISRDGAGLELELRSGVDRLSIKIADASRSDPAALLNTYVRAVGIGRAALSANQRIVLDRLFMPDSSGLTRVEFEADSADAPFALVSINQVQTMRVGDAQKQLPVRIRGVVTGANRSDRWVSLQDDTRGIFVDSTPATNSFPAAAELWEVVGHTAPGNFAPIVVARQMKRLGRGRMPDPARPTWNELANGSMDVQWVEFQGLVSAVHSNQLSLLLPEGPLDVAMENYFEPELRPYEQAVVRIRGTLFANWNATSREVQFGSLLMRNASISVDAPPSLDPFAAPSKSARDLLMFDAQATAFRPVKVRAQVLYTDSQGVLTADDEFGLRILAASAPQLQPGDLIEAVGFPEISGPSPLLRQATIRKTGTAPLPRPRALAGPELTRKGLDSTMVRIEGNLMGTHSEQKAPVLEMQSSGQLFVARLKPGAQFSLRPGSRLQISGVYTETGRNRRQANQVGAFEVLLNSPADILVLSQPSWWTLQRLGAVVGFLLVILILAAVWINQLRRKVEQRTVQLQREIRERERAQHHHTLEAERSRIARDLHDDLGSSLTEIGALASTGQRANAEVGGTPALFDAIAGKARGSIAALDVIVWAVDPEDNSLQSLADYLSGFVGEYLSNSGVVCRFKIPVAFPAVMLEGRVRHELFLAVKETLNNVVRHSGAGEVVFGMTVAGSTLEIVITDNGKGFDPAAGGDGNGLRNLPARLSKVGGRCGVDSVRGQGTTVTVHLPLAVRAAANPAFP
jgi:signal transduction histidine kinase